MANKATLARGASVEIEGQVVSPLTSAFVGKVFVGAFSYFGDDCVIGSCRIGRFCSFASSVKVGLGEHPVDTLSSHPIFYGASNGFRIPDKIGVARDFSAARHTPPIIGHDVWIGANAVITRGVKVGTGAVIGAGAIVTKDVPPYAIVGGVPAKLLRMRFDEETVAKLLASEWWDLPLEAFVGMPINDIESTLDQINALRAEGIERAVYQKQVTRP